MYAPNFTEICCVKDADVNYNWHVIHFSGSRTSGSCEWLVAIVLHCSKRKLIEVDRTVLSKKEKHPLCIQAHRCKGLH